MFNRSSIRSIASVLLGLLFSLIMASCSEDSTPPNGPDDQEGTYTAEEAAVELTQAIDHLDSAGAPLIAARIYLQETPMDITAAIGKLADARDHLSSAPGHYQTILDNWPPGDLDEPERVGLAALIKNCLAFIADAIVVIDDASEACGGEQPTVECNWRDVSLALEYRERAVQTTESALELIRLAVPTAP
jgi:hypothetical protein